jgi:hypothetical protein
MRLGRKHFAVMSFAMFVVLAQSASALAQAVADPRVADLIQAGKVRIGVFYLDGAPRKSVPEVGANNFYMRQ